jgi:hypothetical protein
MNNQSLPALLWIYIYATHNINNEKPTFQIVLLDVVLEQLIPGLAQEALLRPPPRAALLLLRPLRPGLHSQLQDRQKQGPGGAQVSREQKTEHCPETS